MNRVKLLLHQLKTKLFKSRYSGEHTASVTSPVQTLPSVALGGVSFLPALSISKDWVEQNGDTVETFTDVTEDFVCTVGVDEGNPICDTLQNHHADILTALPFAAAAIGAVVVAQVSANLMGNRRTDTKTYNVGQESNDKIKNKDLDRYII